MSPALAAGAAFLLYLVAYRVYARFLGERVFALAESAVTPAHAQRDEVDYVPTRPAVLFGHHFASITGLAPMLGPAVAVIWGWVPALLWVVFGAILIGAVHDMAAIVVSVRHRGMSVGDVTRDLVGPRAGLLFHLIIFFGIALAMGVFVYVIARLFSVHLDPAGTHPGYPQAVFPSASLMVVALVSGVLMHKRGVKLLHVAVVGFAIELATIWFGMKFPTLGLSPESWPSSATWTWILMVYAFAASVLPVWALLQSRDFLNALLLYLGLGLAYLGLFVGDHSFVAPAVNAHPEGAPPMMPFVFIIIACGAASGFHGLVSSGTTAKQLDRETHARPIGYGAMLGESTLGLLATLACTAGIASTELWHDHYANWNAVGALAKKIDAFIHGTTTFVTSLGVSAELASALIAMVVVSFALTTLDSATRLLRFNIEEIASRLRLPLLGNRYLASAAACGVIALFAFYEIDGKPAGLALWALFGTTNQLLAALTLSLATLYLRQRGKPTWFTGLPALFVMVTTLTAMVRNLRAFCPLEGFEGAKPNGLLFVVGAILLLLGVAVLFETALAMRRRPA